MNNYSFKNSELIFRGFQRYFSRDFSYVRFSNLLRKKLDSIPSDYEYIMFLSVRKELKDLTKLRGYFVFLSVEEMLCIVTFLPDPSLLPQPDQAKY